MRDTRKDKAYFDAYIEDELESIADFEHAIEDGEIAPDRIAYVQDCKLMHRIHLLIAKYSRGDDIRDLGRMVTEMTDDFCKWQDTDAYADNLEFASMAYLFGADENVLERIRKKMVDNDARKTYDWLIEFILTGKKGSGKLAWEKSDHFLAEAIEQHSAEPIKTYLSRWYSSSRGCSWYDTHKCDDDELLYYGYWCFEAAAIAKRLELDDTLIRDNKYYPKDLVK
ncbi:MAG: DUF1911 domain-containing protein [Ruminococcus sp.]|nr:DUF1911 domain-containing protein [Ruminococcus sp.]